MDAFDDESQVGDSQPTQLIHDLLDPGNLSDPFLPNHDLRPALFNSNLTPAEDVLGSAGPPQNSSSFPIYHFHGLAETQSQSLAHSFNSDNINNSASDRGRSNSQYDVFDQGSQKENIDTYTKDNELSGAQRSADSLSAISMPTKASNADNRSHPLSKTTPRNAVAKSSSSALHPPSKPERVDTKSSLLSRDPPAVNQYQQQPASHSASRGRFQVPNSELEREPTHSNMFPYSRRQGRSNLSRASSQGIVLVEATPSNSSQSQSQSYVETQPLDPSEHPSHGHQLDIPELLDDRNDGYSSSSSSINRFLEASVPSPELEPTQPATQVDDDVVMDSEDGAEVDDHAPPAPSTNTTAAPRSLATMIPEHKRHKYARYFPAGTKSSATPSRRHDMNQGTGQQEPPTLDDASLPPRPGPSMAQKRASPLKPKSRSIQDASVESIPDEVAASKQTNEGSNVADDPDWQETQPCSQEEYIAPRRTFSSRKSMLQSRRREENVQPTRPVSRSLSPPPLAQSRRLQKQSQKDMQDRMNAIADSEPLPGTSTDGGRSGQKGERQVNAMHHTTSFKEVKNMGIVPDSFSDQEICEATEDEEVDITVPLPAVREEEEEEEEDIPLAARVVSKGKRTPAEDVRGKGKTPPSRVTRSSNVPGRRQNNGNNNEVKGKGKQSKAASKAKELRSTADAEVPSPLPVQGPSKSTRSSRRARSQKAGELENGGGSEEDIDDAATESVEEDGTDFDDYKAGPSSRKRKRSATARGSKASKTSNTPVVRTSKRLRSGNSTVADEKTTWQGTRVFALWKYDGHFYAATIEKHVQDDVFLLRFDDDDTSEVPLTQMRSFSLRAGDEVLTGAFNRPFKVKAMDDDLHPQSVDIGNDRETITRKLSLIRIASKAIECDWRDRLLSINDVVTSSGPVKLSTSPTPSRQAVAGMISRPVKAMKTNSKNILTGTALIITLSATNGNWGSDKVNIITAITSAGGIVVDDISTVIDMGGRHTDNNERWVIEKGDVKWIGSKDIGRLFLIADDSNLKPKFLIALALGIPCLSRAWVDECISKGEDREWLGYTLPQGYSAALNGRPSQQVDVDWGNSAHYLKNIMSNAVPCKIFTKMSILVLGADMVPKPKGQCLSGVSEKAQEANNALARIILSMGANRVEAVSDLKYASNQTTDYDLIVIRDADQYTQELPPESTVHWRWVKDCLVASRFLTRPQWRFIDLENSQELQ